MLTCTPAKIYIAVSSILATMTIAKAEGEEKKPIDIRRDFSSGIARSG